MKLTRYCASLLLMLCLVPFGSRAGTAAIVVAEWPRLSFDLQDAAAERTYMDKRLYRWVILHAIKFDSAGNMYATTPRVVSDVPATLSKLVMKDGEWKLQPFPNREYNAMSNPNGVRSVIGMEIDRNDVLWLLDQGRVGSAPAVAGRQRLLAIDLRTGREVFRYTFTETEADSQCAFLNDLAVDVDRGMVYVTDSGLMCKPMKAGLIAVNTRTRTAKRFLSAPEWVNDEAGFAFTVNGRKVLQGEPLLVGADGIALSRDGGRLYWTRLTGNRLLSLPTEVVRDFDKPEQDIIKAITQEGILPSNADGLAMDRDDNLFMAGVALSGIMVRDGKSGKVSALLSDPQIGWPDTLAWGPGGDLYFVANNINVWLDKAMEFDKPNAPNFRLYKVPMSRGQGGSGNSQQTR